MRNLYHGLLYGLMAILLFANSVSAQAIDEKELKPLLLKNAARLGITPADVNTAVITQAYTDPATKITYVYLQQAYQQIKVYNTIITAAFNDGSFLYASGNFVKDIATKAGNATPVKSYTEAVRSAARHLQLDDEASLSTIANLFDTEKKYTVSAVAIARRDIEVSLYWTPSDDKERVALTWNVNIDVLGRADWWNVRVDARTGDFVQKDNWTVDEHMPDALPKQISALPVQNILTSEKTASLNEIIPVKKRKPLPQLLLQAPPPNVTSATYRVIPFPIESPIHGSFTNVVNPWLMAGAGNNATTIGWHFDSTNNYTITRGNNVFAFLDRVNNNTPDPVRNWPDTSTTPAPSLSFIHNINTAQQPVQNIENKKVALDNLFYWNNLMHDVTYQYGFTEIAGNFQANNLGRGGAGNDYVQANAQDSAGYNNANFATPTEGGSGRMQMYTFSTTPVFRVNTPATIAGTFPGIESSFSTANKLINVGPVTALCALYNDDTLGTVHNACATTAPANAGNLVGKIVLIDATTCTFASKVKKAQNAGAIAVLMYYPTLLGLGGTDNTIVIPTVSITTTVANSIISQINNEGGVSVTLSSGIYLDGDLDNGVICHEYGHGISNRLTGGPYGASCLGNAEQGGEGWSDYFGLMMTTNWTTAGINDGSNLRPIGTYVNNQTITGGGFRRYPYTTNMAVDPLTYANMATNTEVHATGEIWCSTIWDMTWNIIQQVGSITPNLYNSAGTGGNVIAMNLVMTGLKLQPCSPGFLDARNAILAADSILYNNVHKCAIWNAFARRGMGFSANQGLSTSATDQTVATDLPGGVQIAKPLSLIVSANSQTTITRTANCECQPVSGYLVKDTIPAGFTYVSSTPAGTLNGNVLTFPAASFAASESKNFSIVLKAPVTGCTIDSVINDNRETSTTGGLVSSGTPGWITSTLKSHTPFSSWFTADTTVIRSSFLTSVNTVSSAVKNLSILSFWHNFRTETAYDGGVIEYSTNGTTWSDAGPLFIRNGYTTSMDASTTLTGRKAFSGNSRGFIPSLLDLSSFSTTPVSFRFRSEVDAGTGVEGWYVDDVTRANGCGAILKTGTYNNAGVRQDTLMQPVFVIPGSVPLTLLWFYASQVGGQVALDWKTVSEVNVKDFTIEWSQDGSNWTNLGNTLARNSNTNNYNFLHTRPVNGNNYYRIKMNDVDGRFTYSPVRIINISEKGKPALVLIPNPVNMDVTIYISKEAKATSIKVYDAAGSLVNRLSVGAGVQQVKINTATLAAGVYTVEANGAERLVTRMLVQH